MNKITKKYKSNIILDDIEFELDDKTVLIIGENGSGKTALLKVLAGLIKKYDVEIDTKNEVSILLDSNSLFQTKTGYENLEYFLSNDELKKSKYYIDYFNMSEYINKLVYKYSNGMKKHLELVIALSKNKKYLLLDEPTNSLDLKSVKY